VFGYSPARQSLVCYLIKQLVKMPVQMLREKELTPTPPLLKSYLGSSYTAFECCMQWTGGNGTQLQAECKYYNDGKAWLCRLMHKKSTVAWLSVWQGFFKLSFFFLEKHKPLVLALPVTNDGLDAFREAKPFGKLYPLTINIRNKKQLEEAWLVANLKMEINQKKR
jgi:hypothetical protein